MNEGMEWKLRKIIYLPSGGYTTASLHGSTQNVIAGNLLLLRKRSIYRNKEKNVMKSVLASLRSPPCVITSEYNLYKKGPDELRTSLFFRSRLKKYTHEQ
ncbi:hypothetical protein JYU34_003795 [Plutella xylostella]|uniref:Uncharacterized protein n=1 Tax=Plutella xylostella TaxID=51655 RepID=A0ABQ7R0Z8_PLUXY|nr:hypothetical protein JYU34_003795 [Plutella xylostella]